MPLHRSISSLTGTIVLDFLLCIGRWLGARWPTDTLLITSYCVVRSIITAIMSGGNSLDLAKIFVGGLSWQTNEDSLRYHFEQYGEVASVEVMRDRNTNQPRGFAFVVFKSDETVDLIMSSGPHEINHKTVDVKRAQARGQAPPSIHNVVAASDGAGAGGGGGGEAAFMAAMGGGGGASGAGGARSAPPSAASAEHLKCKVFVGGIPLHVDNDGLKTFFSQFGPVTDGIVMVDQNTQRSRGFGFITFAVGSDGAQKAIDAQPIDIDGKRVEVKLATPKADQAAGGGGGGAGGRFRPGGSAALGLRAGAAAAAARSTGEFAGLAAAYGRNGWRGGYGSYAFGKNGWNVKGWEDSSTKVEPTGFSFELLNKKRVQVASDRGRDTKRSRNQ